jgi:hypothetical protein
LPRILPLCIVPLDGNDTSRRSPRRARPPPRIANLMIPV